MILHLDTNQPNESEIADCITKAYGLQGVCTLLKSGINDTYWFQTAFAAFVFRLYTFQWRTHEEIVEEVRMIRHVFGGRIPVSTPLPVSDQTWILQLQMPQGIRYGVLFSAASGEKKYNIPATDHHRIGVEMARMHVLTEKYSLKRMQYIPQNMCEYGLSFIQKELNTSSDEYAFLLERSHEINELFTDTFWNALPSGAVHLDIWCENLHIDAQGNPTFFDFDFCGNGPLALDVAFYVMQIHNLDKYEAALYEPKLHAFYAGYESIRPLNTAEKSAIPLMGILLYLFYLGVQCERKDWSQSFLDETYLKRYIRGLVKRYYEIGLGIQ